jgi:hypothetical protein
LPGLGREPVTFSFILSSAIQYKKIVASYPYLVGTYVHSLHWNWRNSYIHTYIGSLAIFLDACELIKYKIKAYLYMQSYRFLFKVHKSVCLFKIPFKLTIQYT